MASKAVVIVVASFLLVVLLCSLYSIPVFAKISKGPITCTPIPKYNKSIFGPQIECCQTETDSEGIAITYCTLCDDTEPPSNCGGRYTYQASNPLGNALPPGNNTGTPGKTSIFNPIRNATNALPSSNGTGTLPPGSVIKVPAGTINAPSTGNKTGTAGKTSVFNPIRNATIALPTGNNTSNTIAKAAGANSPTGYCVRDNPTSCLPCDPGLPEGRYTCIPSSDWPPPSVPLKNNSSGLATATPLGNAMNAQPTGNSTGTAHPPPTLLAKQPTSGHHYHKGGATSNAGVTNSTGH